jgi:hypothetical protein
MKEPAQAINKVSALTGGMLITLNRMWFFQNDP